MLHRRCLAQSHLRKKVRSTPLGQKPTLAVDSSARAGKNTLPNVLHSFCHICLLGRLLVSSIIGLSSTPNSQNDLAVTQTSDGLRDQTLDHRSKDSLYSAGYNPRLYLQGS